MKLSQRLSLLIIFIAASFSHVSLAYPLFTYTSDKLMLIEGYLNGDLRDISMIEDPYIPGFTVSFLNDKDHSNGTFSSADFIVELVSGYQDFFTGATISNGSITLNENGIATAWNFALSLTYKNFDWDYGPDHQGWFIHSEYGNNTCNCDSLRNERDLYIPRANYSWSYVASLGELYTGSNKAESWTIKYTNVSEPQAWIIMLFGILCLWIKRRIFTRKCVKLTLG